MRIGVLGAAVVIAGLVTACGSSTDGSAVPVGSSDGSSGDKGTTAQSSARPGAKSPKAAVQALIDGVKAGDDDKIEAAVCEHWSSPVNRTGKFALEKELDPPAQKAFPKGTPGEPREDGDEWTVPVEMPGDSPITVKVVKEGKGYFACGFGVTGG